MVIRTEYKSERYSMDSSDPLSVGFKIWFGSLNFQATGNSYLMRITNCDELHPRRSTGLGPIPATPHTDAPAPAQAAAAGNSTPRHRRRSGQRSHQAHMGRRRTAHATARGDVPTDGATASTGEHAAVGPQFPYGMRNATATYASSASTDVVVYEDLPGHHLLAVRNLRTGASEDRWMVAPRCDE
jgi:hypothetical protein